MKNILKIFEISENEALYVYDNGETILRKWLDNGEVEERVLKENTTFRMEDYL